MANIGDKATGKVSFGGAEPEGTTSRVHMSVDNVAMGRLVKLAYKDGFKADAKTEKGKKNQEAAAARSYILLGIDMLLSKRSA